MNETQKTVGSIVRRLENQYISEYTKISTYVEFSQFKNIEKIEAYLNSKHISGEFDAQGREKPFFNIVTGAVNIWFRATDLDRKDIRIKATNDKDQMGAYLLNLHLTDWMKKARFGTFLNDWGISLARYGSSVVKFVVKDGELSASVIPWNRLITDTINFHQNIKIETLEMTEAELLQNTSYDQAQVKALIDAAASARKLLNRNQQDNRADYYRLYEVHGKMSLATLKMAKGQDPNDGDEDKYVQQMHVVSFVASDSDNEYQDFTLYSGREAEDPYMITHLIKEDGRAQSIGAVEHLFQAQWMNNHSQKQIKDQLDVASLVLFQTADQNFVDQNALLAMQNGDILVAQGKGISAIQNNSHDITSIQNWQKQWQDIAQQITSTPDAIAGNDMPSGSAYRQTAILNQEANSLFEIMTENKGLHIEDMCRDYIIPFILKNKMNNSKQIVASLGDNGIQQIEDTFVQNEAIARRKQQVKDALLGKAPVTVADQQTMELQIKDQLSQSGSVRYISPDTVGSKTWKTLFKDLEWDVEVEVTNEQGDTSTILTTLNSLFSVVISLQGQPMPPEAKFIFNKILEVSDVVSPLEIQQLENEQAQAAAQQSQQSAQRPPIETIAFKDLPPEGQAQMAQQAGITLNPQQQAPAPTP